MSDKQRIIIPRDVEMAKTMVIDPLEQLIKSGYFKFKVKGQDNLDSVIKEDELVFVANHSGWMPIDAIFTCLAIYRTLGEDFVPYLFAHDKVVSFAPTKQVFRHLGTLPVAWLKDPTQLPENTNSYALFPEGANGNCKPFWKAYQMEEWKRGFVRLAIYRQAKVIPVAVVGAEESVPVASTINFLKPLLGSVAPLPLFNLPLPSRWKIVFHEPLDFSRFDKELAHDKERCGAIANVTRSIVEDTLEKETRRRPLAWLSKLAKSW